MDKLLKKIINTNILFPLSIIIFIYSLSLINNAVDMDFWARLLQGNAFFQTGSILKTDPFSYTNTHVWLDHEWGASLIFSFITNVFGYTGIIAFKTALIFFMLYFVNKIILLRNKETSPLLSFFLGICTLISISTITNSWLRCHFFTFLFFSVSLYLLENYSKTKNIKNLIMLPVLMLFWSNIHGGCVSLLGILLIYSIGKFLNKSDGKEYLFTLIACLAVIFINPYGVEYVKFIFMATTMPRDLITEWISPFVHSNPMFLFEFKILFIIYSIIFLFGIKKIKSDYTKYLLLIVCGYLSCKYVKNTPFIIISASAFLYEDILNFFKNLPLKFLVNLKIILNILCIILICYSFYISKNIPRYPNLILQPCKIVEFIKRNKLNGNILAPFDMGSYIAFKLFPQNLIYMDGRYEEVYFEKTKKLLDNFYNVNDNWETLIKFPDIHNYIIVPNNALLNDYLVKNPNYKIIFTDDKNTLYSNVKNLKPQYYLPVNDNLPNYDFYYERNAFKTNVNFKKNLFEVK